MDVVVTHGAGLDVQKPTVTACRVTPDPRGQQADGLLERKELGTMTADLLAWSDGLAEAGVTQVARASTGEDWRPVYNRRAGTGAVLLVHAAPVQQVPGRKTDTAEARGVAKLRRDGLLQASVIPPQPQHHLRDLTRSRTKVGPERSREVHRWQGVLERATITVAVVATDLRGVSGRAILTAVVAGQADPATMAEGAQGRTHAAAAVGAGLDGVAARPSPAIVEVAIGP
jgi:transposase